jgi:heterodisulfide reductase subunit B
MVELTPTHTAGLAQTIRAEMGENIFLCYQCVKCTSGCPLAQHFDLNPNQVMRALQLGMDELALDSRTIWLCAGCETCTTRCPQGLDIAGIMDQLKMQAGERGVEPKVREAALFNKVFLRDVNVLGRAYELGLMAEMNLRTGQPFKDLPMGMEMVRKRKISFLPKLARPPRRVKAVEPADNRLAYYPGCSLHSTAGELDASTRAVCESVGLDLVEPEGWVCCGSSAAHKVDRKLATTLPLRNLALIEQAGLDEVAVPCAACFSRLKMAVHEVERDPGLKAEVDAAVGYQYQGSVAVESLLDIMVNRVGLDTIAAKVEVPLNGLQVVNYYGCLLTRPPKVTGAKNPEYPMDMDHLMESLGAESLDWSYKTSCCGASLSVTNTEIALDLSRKILDDARAVGADAVVVACPLCHMNLDARQHQIGLEEPLPILYFTQLMALALGLDAEAVALNKNMVDPRPVLRSHHLW